MLWVYMQSNNIAMLLKDLHFVNETFHLLEVYVMQAFSSVL